MSVECPTDAADTVVKAEGRELATVDQVMSNSEHVDVTHNDDRVVAVDMVANGDLEVTVYAKEDDTDPVETVVVER